MTKWSPVKPDTARTYPQPIKENGGVDGKPSAARRRSRAEQPVSPSPAPDELQRLKDELRGVNQQLSRLGRMPRPGSDAAKHQPLPEKQELLAKRLELEGKIRGLSKR